MHVMKSLIRVKKNCLLSVVEAGQCLDHQAEDPAGVPVALVQPVLVLIQGVAKGEDSDDGVVEVQGPKYSVLWGCRGDHSELRSLSGLKKSWSMLAMVAKRNRSLTFRCSPHVGDLSRKMSRLVDQKAGQSEIK